VGPGPTGIAGRRAPPHKPVGLTFIAVAWEGGVQVKRLIYTGDRHTIRERAAHGVIWLLHERLTRASA
jgi:nicotinamide mononucleotide (NMN) deamidase PncC